MSVHYFTRHLNYTLANEDTALELGLLSEDSRHVLSVAGSGGRVLPLLAKNPRRVTCVDLSQEQLCLTELRMESTRALDHEEFLSFWGYPSVSRPAATPAEREMLFRKIRLSKPAHEFLESMFKQKEWRSVLYDGKWERTFSRLAALNRNLTGAKGLGLFSALTEEEHREYLETQFPRKAWAAVVALLGNAGVFNALLYRGSFPKKNIPLSYYRFYSNCFEKLFAQGPARYNFFLQILFFGKVVFAEGCPIECRADVYTAAKRALEKAEVRYIQGDLISSVEDSTEPVSFLSLSDVPSYFEGETERNFMKRIARNLEPGASVILRNYLRVPQGMDLGDYDTVTEENRAAIEREKVGVYLIDIYRKKK